MGASVDHIFVPCSCRSLITIPIMLGMLVKVRCGCGLVVAYKWPVFNVRWLLLEID